jgi:hypothetical protein
MTASGPGVKSLLADRQDWICPWCRLPLPDDLAYTTALDHIIPRSRGGPDRRWNQQLLHLQCNREKGNKLTAAAEELAAKHGIVLHEPLPTAWPGSSVKLGSGKPNPYRVELEGGPKPHQVVARRFYEVKCDTCDAVVAITKTYGEATDAMRAHMFSERLAG